MDIFWYRKGTVQKVHHTQLKNNLHTIIREKDKVWVDMPTFGKDEEELLRVFFSIHPLTIEDCSKISSRPKIEEFDTYIYIVLYGLDKQGKFTQLNFIIGENYIITVQKHTPESYDQLKVNAAQIAQLLSKDTEFIMHYFADIEVDRYQPILDQLDQEIERIEDHIMTSVGSHIVKEIFTLKHQLLTIKHHVAPQKEIIFTLSRKGNKFMMPSSTDYFRDVYDHIVRTLDDVENYREVINGILEVHLSVTSNRLNDIIKVLTVFSTIFMPLTLIASIYGMNFKNMPELSLHYGYFIVLAVMVVIGTWMYVIFKKKAWV